MPVSYDYFVVLASMRTGSNFLQRNLNEVAGLECHGELFNPFFIGRSQCKTFMGVTLEEREKDPEALLGRVLRATDNLTGFRYFDDHDPRVLSRVLSDRRCAKIVLTRNPLESFLSLKAARDSDKWLMTGDKAEATPSKVIFDEPEFRTYLAAYRSYYAGIRHALQSSGQVAFPLDYGQLHDLDVLNGLVEFLGVEGRLRRLDKSIKKQNTDRPVDRVSNPELMADALVRLDLNGLEATVETEPERGAMVPQYIATPSAGLLFMPLGFTSVGPVLDWMAQTSGDNRDQLLTGFNRRELQEWRNSFSQTRSFSVLRHPVLRAYAIFEQVMLQKSDARLAEAISERYAVPPISEHDGIDETRTSFLAFLRFLRASISGQTSLPGDPGWGTQIALLRGLSSLVPPELIVREEDMPDHLSLLAGQLGRHISAAPKRERALEEQLDLIYDQKVEALTRAAYKKDYQAFGFADWREPQPA